MFAGGKKPAGRFASIQKTHDKRAYFQQKTGRPVHNWKHALFPIFYTALCDRSGAVRSLTALPLRHMPGRPPCLEIVSPSGTDGGSRQRPCPAFSWKQRLRLGHTGWRQPAHRAAAPGDGRVSRFFAGSGTKRSRRLVCKAANQPCRRSNAPPHAGKPAVHGG